MSRRFDRKVAIVTGAARGIGRAIALGLAREGAQLVAVDISSAETTAGEARSLGAEAVAVHADVTAESATRDLAGAALEAFGRIDVLVNNAGIYPIQPVDQMSLADWRKVMALNLDGVFLCTQAVLPVMRKQRYGRIINMASTTFVLGVPHFLHYVTSKGGVIGMTRALAAEVGGDGVTVNCVAPGLTETEGVNASPELLGMWDTLVAGQAIKRREQAADVVGPVLFFASDEAAFVTGQTLCVDGGLAKH